MVATDEMRRVRFERRLVATAQRTNGSPKNVSARMGNNTPCAPVAMDTSTNCRVTNSATTIKPRAPKRSDQAARLKNNHHRMTSKLPTGPEMAEEQLIGGDERDGKAKRQTGVRDRHARPQPERLSSRILHLRSPESDSSTHEGHPVFRYGHWQIIRKKSAYRSPRNVAAVSLVNSRGLDSAFRIVFMQRILIIGATGHVGNQVVSQLTATGAQVRALVRKPAAVRLPAEVEVVSGDLTIPETLDQCVQGMDTVFLVWTAPPAAAAPALERIAKHAQRIVFLSAPLKTPHPLFQQPNRQGSGSTDRAADRGIRPGSGPFCARNVRRKCPRLVGAAKIRAGDVVAGRTCRDSHGADS